ncbi:MAG: hypothetical protein Q9159_002627 [Coniocarpon cinnabarinum]
MAVSTSNSGENSLYQTYISYAGSGQHLPNYLAAVNAISDEIAKSQQPLTTLSEAIALVASLSDLLKSSLPLTEALAISSGTDAFQKRLVTTLNRPGTHSHQSSTPAGSVADTKKTIIETAGLCVEAASAAREQILTYGPRLIIDGNSIIVPSYSRVVDGLLREASRSGVKFQVFFVADASESSPAKHQLSDLSDFLQGQNIGQCTRAVDSITELVQTNPPNLTQSPQTFTLSQVFVLSGAAAIFASGGALVSVNAQLIATAAQRRGVPVWIAAETAKCVKEHDFVLSHGMKHRPAEHSSGKAAPAVPTVTNRMQLGRIAAGTVTSFITEEGPCNSCAIAEESLKSWS